MKTFPFSELIPEMYPLVLHNLDLIKSWNDHSGIEHRSNGDTIQVKTRLLEPLKDAVPDSFTFKSHRIGDFKIYQESDLLIRYNENPERLRYSGNYDIGISLSHQLFSVQGVLEDPKLRIYGTTRIDIPDLTIGPPDTECYISSISSSKLDELRKISRRMQFNRMKYFQSLITQVKNKRFTPTDIRYKLYDQFDFIDIFQQSFMELSHSDLIVFTPAISLTKSHVSASIVWTMMNVYRSIILNIKFRHPFNVYNEEREYVLGWQVVVHIYN